MASRKATGRSKSTTKKLKLKKETLKDLDSRGKAVKGGQGVKGGQTVGATACTCGHRADCGGDRNL